MTADANNKETSEKRNFIHQIVEKDVLNGKNDGRVYTRFPPEPNGFLHIGHAQAIWVSFGVADKYKGKCNLRFDDTNPAKEEEAYVQAIINDVTWLGYQWDGEIKYASDNFKGLFDFAVKLINEGLAYVDEQDSAEISEQKGTPTTVGKDSPFRNRPISESLDLFYAMNKGEVEEGQMVLRAKIDMASPNMLFRDPVIYRVLQKPHHRTGSEWKVYPMYDFAHGQVDYFEGITHSICTLEFDVHRPLYDWFIDQLKDNGDYRPRQYEFARLNLNYTVMSKRKLLELVEKKYVSGWDDPRMPTVSGLRRRGYTPQSIRRFSEMAGITKVNGTIDISLLEYCIREDLNKRAQRVMAVLDPLKVVITNYPDEKVEMLEAVNNPEDESMGKRQIPFTKEIYIERSDFMEDAPKKFFRLAPGREVRLRYAYFVTCEKVVKDSDGKIIELHCTYDPESRGGKSPDGRKVKGTLHWVSATENVNCEVRLYDRLFDVPAPDGDKEVDFKEHINKDSLKVLNKCFIEPFAKGTKALDHFQFERLGYFSTDIDSSDGKLVFNRTVQLKDTWAKMNS